MGPVFGTSLALSGTTLAVGTESAVYVYGLAGRRWVLEALLEAPPGLGGVGREFGYSVALADDLLIVGAPGPLPPAAGAALVYGRDGSGRWQLEATLGAGTALQNYGQSVALTDGFAFVGGIQVGFVDVFQSLGGGRWRHAGRLTGGSVADFGAELAASGSTLAVGGDDPEVVVFLASHGRWSEQARLSTPGSSLARVIALDGDTLVAGDLAAGAVSVFTLGRNAWSLANTLTMPAPISAFGSGVAVSGHTALVAGLDLGPARDDVVWVVDGLDEP